MNKADYVLYSDSIFTAENENTFSGGVAIKANRILSVGTRAELDAFICSNTEIRDYGDRLIMPGFVEAHAHFPAGALFSSEYFLNDLFDSKSEQECAEMVHNFAQKHPDLKRIIGQGWFPACWGDAALPTKFTLDNAVPDKPVYLAAADAHTGWVNSKALKELTENYGFDPSLPEYTNDVVKLPDGSPSGVLRENAWFHFGAAMVNQPDAEIDEEVERKLIKDMNRFGITSLCEMSGVLPGMNYDALERIEKSGDLTMRIYLYPGLKDDEEQRELHQLCRRFHSERLCVIGAKGMVDGVTSTYTGFLLEPYADKPETRGATLNPREFYEKAVLSANRHGFGVRLHCIADGSVQLALDCFEKSAEVNDTSKLRNAIEHIENIHPDDIPRFAKMNIVPSMQPRHLPLENNEKISRIGEARCRWEWPFRSFMDAGATLAFGTDYPVVDYDPFASIFYAVTRVGYDGKPTGINPEEAVTIGETLRAYTYGGAYSTNREKEIGTLSPGKFADLIVLDRDLFRVPPGQIPQCRVLLTMMDGKIVYEA